jgi:membrane protease YdiL (CAAX protease family)
LDTERAAPSEWSFGSVVKELGREPLVVLCGASAFLVASHYQSSTGHFRTLVGSAFDQHPWNGVLGYLWWFGSSVVFYLALPLILARVTRGSFHERYGFQLGDWKVGLQITGVLLCVMLPVTWAASQLSSFQGTYPLAGPNAYRLQLENGATHTSWSVFLVYELGYCLYFLAWEFLFRGWMVHGLMPSWGRGPAILVQVVPFAVMHLGKAEMEALGSIAAGVALGLLSARTRSFLYGAVIHCAVAVWMDWLGAKGALLGP